MSRAIGDPQAKPLTCVCRDQDTKDGGRKGQITSNPSDVDGVVKRAWQAIHNGMAGCMSKATDLFLNTYCKFTVNTFPFKVDDITAEMVRDSFTQTKESAGALDGWSPKELSLLSLKLYGTIAIMLNQIEAGANWPKAALHARIVYLEKAGAIIGQVMSYRQLTITSPFIRCWATMRLRHLEPWVTQWALPEMHAGVPEMGQSTPGTKYSRY